MDKTAEVTDGVRILTYVVTPREAVIAAYAQMTKHDWNTWGYQGRYGHLAHQGDDGKWICGEWRER